MTKAKNPLANPRGARISNPIPFEERIFKCARCKEHKYMTELSSNDICKACWNNPSVIKIKIDETLPEPIEERLGEDQCD